MIIRSLYRDRAKDQFEFEVLGEATDMGEPAYVCRLLPQYRSEFREGDKTFLLRKCMIKIGLYEIVKDRKPEQLTLF